MKETPTRGTAALEDMADNSAVYWYRGGDYKIVDGKLMSTKSKFMPTSWVPIFKDSVLTPDHFLNVEWYKKS